MSRREDIDNAIWGDDAATEDEVRAFVARTQAEAGLGDQGMVAVILMNLYRHARVLGLMRDTGFDWDGRSEKEVQEGIEAGMYVLGLDDSAFEQDGLVREFLVWRIAELHRMPYDEYLQSPEWKDVRYFARRAAGDRCQTCNATKRLHTHHRTYARRGAENLDDLTVLCADCHGLIHEHRRLSK